MIKFKTAKDLLWSELQFIERPFQAFQSIRHALRTGTLHPKELEKLGFYHSSEIQLETAMQQGLLYAVNPTTTLPVLKSIDFSNERIQFELAQFESKHRSFFEKNIRIAIEQVNKPEIYLPIRIEKAPSEASTKSRPKTQWKHHRIYINAEPEKGCTLPQRYGATLVVLNRQTNRPIVRQLTNLTPKSRLMPIYSRVFKLKEGEEFDVFIIPEANTQALKDLSSNKNLSHSVSQGKISTLEITNSTESSDALTHQVDYKIKNYSFRFKMENTEHLSYEGIKYHVINSNNQKIESGKLDKKGKGIVNNISVNECKILFPEIDNLIVDISP